MKNKLYRNVIISEDGFLTAVILKMEDRLGSTDSVKYESDTREYRLPTPADDPGKARYLYGKATREVVDAVRRVIDRYHTPDFPISLSGVPVMLEFYNVLMTATLKCIVSFGFLMGVTILMALMADFLLAPALLILVTRERR